MDIDGDGREDVSFYAADADREGTHLLLAQGGGRLRLAGVYEGSRGDR